MNWEKIQSKYPKAFQLLCDYHENEVVGLIDHPTVWDQDNLAPTFWELRHLYDFLDENEIWIETFAHSLNHWAYDIFKLTEDNFTCIAENSSYFNRTEAEKSAFTKAFELLEEKL